MLAGLSRLSQLNTLLLLVAVQADTILVLALSAMELVVVLVALGPVLLGKTLVVAVAPRLLYF
jgi:hypothetical protein